MVKRLVMCAVVVLFIASVAFTGQKKDEKAGSWSGWVTDTMCAAKGAKAGHTDCANKCVKEHGAKYALYDTESKKVYVLDPQDKAAEHAGHEVTVKGSLDGDTIKVTSIEMKPAKGM
jgi:hypothetical protein